MEAISYSTTPVTSIQSMAWYGIYISEKDRYISTNLDENTGNLSTNYSTCRQQEFWSLIGDNSAFKIMGVKNQSYLSQSSAIMPAFYYGVAINWSTTTNSSSNLLKISHQGSYFTFNSAWNKCYLGTTSKDAVWLQFHKLYATNLEINSENTINLPAENGEGYWATFSSTTPVLMDTLVSPYALTLENDEFQLVRFEKVAIKEAGSTIVHIGYLVPANTGVLLHCITGSGTYYIVEETESAGINTISGNLLHPAASMPSGSQEGDNSNYYFKLAYGSSSDTDLGWYWGADGGAPFTITNSNSAYLSIPKDAPADALQGLILTKEMIEKAEELTSEQELEESVETDETTAIKETSIGNENADSDAIYNLLGQPVTHPQPGQIYIQNRKKYVIQ